MIQLVNIVDDLLDVSRITQSKLELRTKKVNLAEVVQSAIESSQKNLEDSDHQLTLNLPQQSIFLEADPYRLAQVFSNLLSNAGKYTSAGGKIEVSVKQEGDEAVIKITDNGIGIPHEKLDSIFEMFSQVDQPKERANTGLGIGLSLVRSLIEMHGGQVVATSDGENQGSTFQARLPILSKEEKRLDKREGSDSVVSQAASTSAQHRILVVDDNESAAKMLCLALNLFEHEVHHAKDGKEGVKMAIELVPEVVLMDLGMPKMDGYEAARRIRGHLPENKILLIALSGWGQEADRSKTKEAGFDYHLVKPITPSEVHELLLKWLPDSE
ncbi:Chemotaxis protein methyltransferase CheR [Planctomycetales bacterium 10988]|nr:Chemotaxis protein methyltransferase CheR [Planctomycetales bacterium 10988]